jgi:hypothetical protein
VRLVEVTFELPTQRSGDLPGDRQDQICGAQLGKPRCTKGIMEAEYVPSPRREGENVREEAIVKPGLFEENWSVTWCIVCCPL